jgi:hypothetical protein
VPFQKQCCYGCGQAVAEERPGRIPGLHFGVERQAEVLKLLVTNLESINEFCFVQNKARLCSRPGEKLRLQAQG